MLFNKNSDKVNIGETLVDLDEELNTNMEGVLDDSASEDITSSRPDDELSEIAMDIYAMYTDDALSGIRRGYADKNSESLLFSKQKTLSDLKRHMKEDDRDFTDDEINKMLDIIDSKIYRYDILEQFMKDEEISDIKTYSYNNIRVKRRGCRYPANISFKSDKEYRDFVTRILERNNINFGTANANQTFTDDTQDEAILRVSCISELLIDTKMPCVAIRKIPKEKRTLEQLEERGMFDTEKHPKETAADRMRDMDAIKFNDQLRVLIPQMVDSRGIIFTGKGASGKTSLMNGMLELVPHDESLMICQENSELFMKDHPDYLSAHVLTNKGDAKISYGLSALTEMALLIDLDRIVVGEIKRPDEADGLSKASITGHKCWTSVHGENCDMAIKKMADYISQANKNYTFENALNQLQGFEYVVHLTGYQVDEIVQITGWDYDKNELITQCVYKI